MSPSARGLAVLLCSVALLGGCKKEEEPASVEDRTLAKLRQEVDRVNKGGATNAPPAAAAENNPNAELAELAAGHEAESARNLTPPGANDTVHVDTFAVKLTALESLHSLRGSGKLSLTTSDLFVRARLIAQNVGPKRAPLALSGAKLVDAANKEYPLAQDAQTLAGTRTLDRTWDTEERDSLVLLFEVPPSALGPGLTLVLPTSGSAPVRIPLQ